jgi:raffinose/stachyose/melibiose transport system permease protein
MKTKIVKDVNQRNTPIFFLFLLPALLAFCIVIIVPFIIGVYYSFTDWTSILSSNNAFVGFTNYKLIFGDIAFLHSFLVTTAYAALMVFVVNFFAFFMATLVTQKLKLTSLYRAGFFLPNLIGGIILGYIWQFIFNNTIPALGGALGISWLQDNLFLANRWLTLFAYVTVGTWQYAGYIMMIYIAAIQGVPKSIVEAAQIDGAHYGHVLRHIQLPLIAPAFTVSMFLTLINSFKMFDVNYALTAGGPSGSFMGIILPTNEFLALNIYNTAFSMRRLAEGQAKAVVFFLIITVFGLIQVYFNKKKEIEMLLENIDLVYWKFWRFFSLLSVCFRFCLYS